MDVLDDRTDDVLMGKTNPKVGTMIEDGVVDTERTSKCVTSNDAREEEQPDQLFL